MTSGGIGEGDFLAPPSADRRSRALKLGAGSGAVSRVVALVAGFATVPIVLSGLGVPQYGAFVLIVGLATLLPFADLGIGNGVVTMVGRAMASSDLESMRRITAAALVTTTVVAAVLAGLFLATDPVVPWATILGLGNEPFAGEVDSAMRVFVALFALGIAGNLGYRLLAGMQRTHIVNVWQAVGPVLALAGVWVARDRGWDLPDYVAIVIGIPTLIACVVTCWVLVSAHRPLRPRKGDLERTRVREVLGTGGLYFGLALAAAVAFETDALVLSWIEGPDAVSTYSLAARVFSLVSVFAAVAFLPLWPAFAEALSSGDVEWSQRVFRKSVVRGAVMAVGAAAALALAMPLILRLWVDDAVSPPDALVIGLAVWTVLQVAMIPVSMLLNGAAVVRFQLIAASAMAATNLVLSIVLTRIVGVSGPVWGTVIAYTLCSVLPAAWFIARRFSWTATHPLERSS